MTALQPKSLPRRRWRIAWLLGLGVLVNYFDRVNLSVSHDALKASFGISAVTFGYLSGAYNWTYALCQLPIGVILDKFGIRRIGRISIALWSIATFAAAATPTLSGFFASRFLLGIGEASTFPANAKAIGLWFPPRERSFPTSIFDSAAKFASAIGVPLIGLLLLRIGWRLSFVVTGLVSVFYLLLFIVVYRDPREDPALTSDERIYIENRDSQSPVPKPSGHASLGYLLRQPKIIGMALGFGAYNYVFYLLLTWLPTYLSTELRIDLLHSFLYTGLPWLFATFTDLVIGGWLTDALVQRGFDGNRVRKTILIGGTACGLGIIGAANAHSALPALLWISISIGGLSATAPVGWSILSLITPGSSVGTAGGIINFSNQLSGIAAPIVTGYLVASHQSFALAFTVPAIYLLLGIAGYIFLLGRIEPIAPQPQGT